MQEEFEFIQILNTAIIKRKEKRLDVPFEERLQHLCQSPVTNALNVAINELSESQQITKEQAAVMLMETIRELDSIWGNYLMMEGIEKIKGLISKKDYGLKKQSRPHDSTSRSKQSTRPQNNHAQDDSSYFNDFDDIENFEPLNDVQDIFTNLDELNVLDEMKKLNMGRKTDQKRPLIQFDLDKEFFDFTNEKNFQ